VTGYTVHTGSNEKFAAGWEQVFGSQKRKKSTSGGKTAVKPSSAKRTTRRKKGS
jgi:hypothetical protein